MTPREAIADLLGTYCDLVDAADWDAVGAMFADGCLADWDGNAFATGAAEIAAFFARGTRLYRGSPRTKHLVLTSIFEDISSNDAIARSSFLVLQQLEAEPLAPIVTGRYRDTFRCIDGVWRFAERRFAADLVGDISRHLTYEVR